MPVRPTTSLSILILACMTCLQGQVLAQENPSAYPSRPVTMVIPYTPAGPVDVDTRVYSQRLSDAMGKPFVLDYKPGAGSTIGTAYVAKAPPDGYTLLSVTSTLSTNPALYPNLNFDTARDLAPVSLMYTRAFVLLVHPDFPAKSWSEYVAHVRANPGRVNFGTSGAGGIYHIGGAWLHSEIKARVTYVHYKGANPVLMDTIAGRVDAIPSTVFNALPHIKAGKVRAIATLSITRSPLLPELRTVAEQGLAGFDYSSWGGILAPAGTPAPIISRLSGELAKIARTTDVIKRGEADGTVMVGSSPQAFRELLAAEIARWKTVVKDSAIVLEE